VRSRPFFRRIPLFRKIFRNQRFRLNELFPFGVYLDPFLRYPLVEKQNNELSSSQILGEDLGNVVSLVTSGLGRLYNLGWDSWGVGFCEGGGMRGKEKGGVGGEWGGIGSSGSFNLLSGRNSSKLPQRLSVILLCPSTDGISLGTRALPLSGIPTPFLPFSSRLS